MLKGSRSYRRVLVLLGLALVVSLFVAAPARAEFSRSTELEEGLKLIDWYRWTPGGNGSGGSGSWYTSGGGGGGGNIPNNAIYVRYIDYQNSGLQDDSTHAIRLSGKVADSMNYYAAAFNSGSSAVTSLSDDFLDSITITARGMTGDSGDDMAVLATYDAAQSAGNYFYDLGSMLADVTGDWEIVFEFTNAANEAYLFELFTKDAGAGPGGVGVPSVPEPATLAILGLGLAGLGLARRRMR